MLLPDGNPVFLKENSRKCYQLKTQHYCVDGATEYGDPNEFSNNEEQVFLVTCSEYLYEQPVSRFCVDNYCEQLFSLRYFTSPAPFHCFLIIIIIVLLI